MHISHIPLNNFYSKTSYYANSARFSYENINYNDQISFSGGAASIGRTASRGRTISKGKQILAAVLIGASFFKAGFNFFSNNNKHNVVVIDTFKKQYDLNKDNKPDTSHGQIVVSLIKRNHSDINIIQYENVNIFGIDAELNSVIKLINKGSKIDAVNLSISFPMTIKRLSSLTGINLTPENLDKYRENIIDALKRNSMDEKTQKFYKESGIKNTVFQEAQTFSALLNVIKKIEELSEMGVKVYIGAGNDGKNGINALTLAKGSINVGALKDGKTATYSGDNNLVNRKENGTIEIKPIAKDNKFIGYDTNEDGIVDIPAYKISGSRPKKGEMPSVKILEGTSFCTPRALDEDLAEKP